MKKNKNIDKNMTVDEVLNIDSEFVKILQGFGLHCFGCPMSRMETLEEAAQVHNIDLGLLLDKLNAHLNK